MEAQRIKIEIKGIQRDVSPAMAPLGSCQELVNLRLWDGALRPVAPKLLKYNATAGEFVPPIDEQHPEYAAVYVLTIVVAGNGIVKVNTTEFEGAATFLGGTSVFLEAIANDGRVFIGYTGDLISTDSTEPVVMDADKTITAVFGELSLWDEAGTVELDPDFSGALVEFTTEAEDYVFMVKSSPRKWFLLSVTIPGGGDTWFTMKQKEPGALAYSTLNEGIVNLYEDTTLVKITTDAEIPLGEKVAVIRFRSEDERQTVLMEAHITII